ncbi:MAG: DUF1269 domain-containing protein [Candidatus Binatia bacterium]
MATLTALKFDNADGAEKALEILFVLQGQQFMPVVDAAVVSWPKGKSRPSTRQAVPTTGPSMLDGAFWGMLFGLIFFVPVLGAGVRMGTAALAGALTDVGIDDTFVYQVRSKVTEGTSALFIISRDAVMDRVVETSGSRKPELIATNLPRDQEARLRYLFAQPGATGTGIQS